jgi:predicted DNA-binding transcriptional regulator AlpA
MNIRQKQLLEMLDISRTTLWRMIKRDEFPAPNRDNPRKLIWSLVEIENHLDQLN